MVKARNCATSLEISAVACRSIRYSLETSCNSEHVKKKAGEEDVSCHTHLMRPLRDPESEGALVDPHQAPLPRLPDQVQAVVTGAGLDLVLVKQSRHNLRRDKGGYSLLTHITLDTLYYSLTSSGPALLLVWTHMAVCFGGVNTAVSLSYLG